MYATFWFVRLEPPLLLAAPLLVVLLVAALLLAALLLLELELPQAATSAAATTSVPMRGPRLDRHLLVSRLPSGMTSTSPRRCC
jgi:hypothetical protein